MKNNSNTNYYGLHAVIKLFENRKEDIQRIYCLKEKVKELRAILKWCADHKKPYHIVEERDLEKLTDSTHHEGVCFVAKPYTILDFKLFLSELRSKQKALVLFLNEVDNPHNLGAIIRTLAHFGIIYLIVDNPIQLSPSCCRIAQGGAEFVKVVFAKDATHALDDLKKLGFAVYGTSSHEGQSLQSTTFAKKSIIVMGSESEGIKKAVAQKLQTFLKVDGSSVVESLNVSTATALFCYQYCLQHGIK